MERQGENQTERGVCGGGGGGGGLSSTDVAGQATGWRGQRGGEESQGDGEETEHAGAGGGGGGG